MNLMKEVLSAMVAFIILTNSFSFAVEIFGGNPFKEKELYIGLDISRDVLKCKEAFKGYLVEFLKTVSWENLRKANIRKVNVFLFDNQVRIKKSVAFKGSGMSRSNWKRFSRLVKENLKKMLKELPKQNLALRDMTAAFDYVQMQSEGNREKVVLIFSDGFQQYDRKVMKKLKYDMPERSIIVSAFGKCLYETFSQRKLIFERYVKDYWENVKNVKWLLLP